jgi:hypothetical protein
MRALAEFAVSTLVFTAMNAGGVALFERSTFHVRAGGGVDVGNSQNTLIAAGSLFVLAPFAAALSSYLVGRGSDRYRPGLLSPTLGAYGMSTLAVGAGVGLAFSSVDRDTVRVLNGALFLSVPLAAVLLQNALKDER